MINIIKNRTIKFRLDGNESRYCPYSGDVNIGSIWCKHHCKYNVNSHLENNQHGQRIFEEITCNCKKKFNSNEQN